MIYKVGDFVRIVNRDVYQTRLYLKPAKITDVDRKDNHMTLHFASEKIGRLDHTPHRGSWCLEKINESEHLVEVL